MFPQHVGPSKQTFGSASVRHLDGLYQPSGSTVSGVGRWVTDGRPGSTVTFDTGFAGDQSLTLGLDAESM